VNLPEEVSKDLIIRYLAGDLSSTEENRLREWKDYSPENRMRFDELVKIWQFAGATGYSTGVDTAKVFARLRNRIDKASPDLQQTKEGIIRIYAKKVMKYAAILIPVFLLGGAAAFWILRNRSAELLHPMTYKVETPAGTRSVISLADGTRVWLNAGSNLTYSQNYNVKKREVNLTGEAYFNVAKDASRPFVVKSAGLEIKALGTAFNVKAYPSDNRFTATLVEGSIVVEGKSRTGKFSHTLKPKQNITLVTVDGTVQSKENVRRVTPGARDGEMQIRKIDRIEVANDVNTLLYTSWKDRRWVIERASFDSFAEMLERRYNVSIAYDPVEMKDISFTGIIENETLEQVFRILQMSAPLKYKFGKGEVEISLDTSRVSRFRNIMN